MVEFWRMGPTALPGSRMGEFARELEAEGWDGLALGENNNQPDPYALLALAAAATTDLRLGTATAVPIRHPILAAISWWTIQGISSGRARFSLGRGDSAVKALQMSPMTIAKFDNYLQRLQGYLKRDEVDIDGAKSTIAGMLIVDPSFEGPKPLLDVAAAGPRALSLGVRHADSVSFAVGADPERIQNRIDHVRKECTATGRDFDDLSLGCYVQVSVSENGDLAKAREEIRPLATVFARFSGYEGKHLLDVRDSDKEQLQRAAESMDAKFKGSGGTLAPKPGGLPGELDLYRDSTELDDEFLDRFAIVGPPEYCAERLKAIMDLGIDRILIGTRMMGMDVLEKNTHRIGRQVLPLLRTADART
jgi:5,10-methylenetetrahydromethanopterin reductase